MNTTQLATLPTAINLPAAINLPTAINSPSNAIWHLGPIPIRAYALCILAGIFICVWWGDKRYRARGGQKDVVLDTALVAVPCGIVGARLYHVITSPDAYFGPEGNLALIPQVWHGGLGIWGGIGAGALAVWLYLRYRKLEVGAFAEAVAPTLLVAQAVGRLGNWFNQELFGAPTTLPWGLRIDAEHLPAGYAPGTLFHPTFLYEALWNLAGAAALVWLGRRFNWRGGVSMWAYMVIYTAGRIWVEYLRIDDAQHILGIRLNVWTSAVVCLSGLTGLFLTLRNQKASAQVGTGLEEE